MNFTIDDISNELARFYNSRRFNFTNVQFLYNLPERILPYAKWGLHSLDSILSYGRLDMPMTIGIETISVCSKRCGYCPVGTKEFRESREHTTMTDDLFRPIIADLASWPRTGRRQGFNGALYLNAFGEPTQDKKIAERVKYARQMLPESFIGLFSNGDGLTPSLFNELVDAGIDKLVITIHDPSEFNSQVWEIYGTKKGKEKIRLIKSLNYLSNRGGRVEVEDEITIAPRYICLSPAYAFWINTDGKMGYCFNDTLVTHQLGRYIPGFTKLLEIWDNPENKILRDNLKHGRWEFLPDVCYECRKPYHEHPAKEVVPVGIE